MDTTSDYFSEYESNFFRFRKIIFFKMLKDDENKLVEKLTFKNVRVWAASGLEYQFCPNFDNFIDLPKDSITLENLRLLEGKKIILEWSGPATFNLNNCSAISCMEILKENEIIQYNECDVRENGIVGVFLDENKNYYESSHKILIGKNKLTIPEGVIITIDNLLEPKIYKNDPINSYLWKIWIPLECYNNLYT